VDVVTAIQSHHYLRPSERVDATRVCFDLLRGGGIYVTFENIRPFSERGVEIGKNYWKNFQLASGREAETVDKHLQRFGTEYFPITVEEHLSLLRNSGFQVVEILWYSYMQAGFYCMK
jgi:tRNA (cmo5U34)-methyltransferase